MAFAIVRKAIALGFRNAAIFGSDPALGPLRYVEDFRLITTDVGMPAEPFAPGR